MRRRQRHRRPDAGAARRARTRHGQPGGDGRGDSPADPRRRHPCCPRRRDPRGLPQAGRAPGVAGPGGRGAQQRDRRGPAECELCRAAGDLPQCLAARRRCSTPAGAATPRCSPTGRSATATSGLRPPEGGAVDRRAGDGALRPRRLRRHVLDRHRERLPRRGGHQRRLGPRRDRRAGRGRSRRYLVFKPLLGDPALRADPARRRSAARRARWCMPAAAPPDRAGGHRPGASARPSCCRTPRSCSWPAGRSAVEQHYGRPMDLEWARDGETGELFIVQARPETVHGTRQRRGAAQLAPAGEGQADPERRSRSARLSPAARSASSATPTDIEGFPEAPCWSPRHRSRTGCR